jgi:hypothetical protein
VVTDGDRKETAMPLIQKTASLAANATIDNVITGDQYEFLPFNALLEFGINGSATGLVMDVYSGSDSLCESAAVSLANRMPIYPDDYTLTDVAAAGERIKVRLRNTTGGALTYFVSVRVTPGG